MQKVLQLLLFYLFPLLSFSQTVKIQGTVTDTINYKNMAFSSVSLLGVIDSIFYHSQFTNTNGGFLFDNVKKGAYNLLITRPSFADYEELISLDSENIDLGNINLLLKENLLKELIVKDWKNAIRIKGDTTEFLADSFYIDKNATVEDLLKRLPGLQVDKEGKITAQGETVKRVLVDGEEFFGDDPTIATRNLKAENIDKVQVFDQKSEQTILTGVEDGQKEKTINLTLKEDAKKGYFGKVRSAGGPTNTKESGQIVEHTRYENEAMLNVFNAKRKISMFGTLANTNQTGLNWSDANSYAGGQGETRIDDESGSIITYYNQGEDESFARSGIPRTGYIGSYYSNKFNDGKHAINGTASYKNFRVFGFDNNYTKYILPDTVYYNNQEKTFTTNKELYNARGRLDFKFDSTSSLRVNFDAGTSFGKSESKYNTNNYNSLEQLVNSNQRSDSSESTRQNLSISSFYSKKFKLKGRSFSAELKHIYSNGENKSYQISSTHFFGISDSISSYNQRKEANTKSLDYSARLTYTEPFAKDWFMILNYSITDKTNNTTNTTLSKNGDDYSLFVDSLSNKFDYNILVNQGGLSLKHSYKKISYSFGGQISLTDLNQKNILKNTTQNRPFYNFFPSAVFNYKIKNTSNFNVNYSGYTRQPSLQQIQPLQDNSNPLIVYIGNPNLVQSFTNNISISYNSYAPIKGRGTYSYLSYRQTNNDFTNLNKVDNKGVREYQTVNVNGNFNVYAYSYFYLDFKKISTHLNFNLNGSISNNNNYINGLFNTNKSRNIGFGSSISYDLKEKLEIALGADWDLNNSVSSLRKDIPTKYYTASYSGSLNCKLPYNIAIKPALDYNFRQKTADFGKDLNVLLLNLRITKKALKSKALEFSIFAYDILNQNIGFNRSAYNNFVNEQTYSIIQRYILFGVTYNLSGGGAKKAVNDDEED